MVTRAINDIYFAREIKIELSLWGNVLHCLINDIIFQASCNLHYQQHDSKSENFVVNLSLLSNYGIVLEKRPLKGYSKLFKPHDSKWDFECAWYPNSENIGLEIEKLHI